MNDYHKSLNRVNFTHSFLWGFFGGVGARKSDGSNTHLIRLEREKFVWLIRLSTPES